jgi:hypothetical protein
MVSSSASFRSTSCWALGRRTASSTQVAFDVFGRTSAQRYPTTEQKASEVANGMFNWPRWHRIAQGRALTLEEQAQLICAKRESGQSSPARRNKMKKTGLLSVLAVAIAAAAPCAAFAADGLLTINAGVDYTSGNYGQSETTNVLALSLGAKYEIGRWTYKASLPWLRISGPSNVVGVGSDSVVLPGFAGERRSVSGMGDVVAAASYNLLGSGAPLILDVGGKIKFGTADEGRGLGTGKNDYSLQADVFKPLGDLTPFATLGYRWYGDPAGIDLRNAFYASLGAAYRESALTTVGVAYDFRQSIVAGGAQVRELTGFLSHRLDREWKVQLYLLKGFADASPDAGAGAVLGYSF